MRSRKRCFNHILQDIKSREKSWWETQKENFGEERGDQRPYKTKNSAGRRYLNVGMFCWKLPKHRPLVGDIGEQRKKQQDCMDTCG
jgi:hypothetical protein